MRRAPSGIIGLAVAVLLGGAVLTAHSGPPFPIVSNQTAGAYSVSIWTDPDTTDDRTPGGQFWVTLDPASPASAIPPGTRVTVAIRPLDRQGTTQSGEAQPVNESVSRQFIALLMDHEGRFGVHVTIEGPLGRADVDSQVDATYDLRPPPALIALYMLPFLAVGALWGRVLLKRRRAKAAPRR